MAEITTTTLGELLKRLYAPWEIEQLVNLEYPVLSECARKGSAQLGGEGFYFPVRTQSAEGHAYIAEDGVLPTGQQSTVKQAKANPTVHAGVVQLTGLSMSVSSGNAMAFARSFDENVQQTIAAMSAYKEGALFRDGSGILATIAVDPGTSNPITLSDVSHIREGMAIQIAEATDTTPALRQASTVTAVDWVNKTITIADTPLAGIIVTDRVYLSGSHTIDGATNIVEKEPVGLEASLLTTGTYLNINRATSANWASNALAAGSVFLDEDILLRSRTRVTQESGIQLQTMSKTFKAVSHPMQVDVLFKLAIPRIRYSGNENFDLGNSSEVRFGNIPFVTSYQAPASTVYVGDWRYSQSVYTPKGELHIDTEYNGSALKWVATRDVGLAFAKEYCQFIVKRPNAFVRISGLSEQAR